jgi:hypothetical protein
MSRGEVSILHLIFHDSSIVTDRLTVPIDKNRALTGSCDKSNAPGAKRKQAKVAAHNKGWIKQYPRTPCVTIMVTIR